MISGIQLRERERNYLTSSGLDAAVTPAMMRAVARIAFLIVLFIGATIPFRSIVIGLLPGVYLVYGIALVAGYTLSGLLLGWWSRRSSNHGVTILAATYLFAAVMVLTNVILILEPNRQPDAVQASLWFWLLWHIGIPLGILASTVRRPSIGGRLRQAVLVAAGACAAAFVFVWFSSHHFILFANNRTTMVFPTACAVAGAIAALALWRLWARRSTALDLLLALVVLTVVGDLGLVLSSPLGYSVGTYAARIMGLISGLIVLSIFVRWMLATIERSDLFAQYVTLADGSPSIMFLTDERDDREVVYINQRWTELTGQPTAAALGKGYQAFINPDDLVRRTDDPQWVRSGDARVRVRDRTGNDVWHRLRYGAARGRSGRQIGWVGTLSDIDREQRALDESRRLAEQLRTQYESEREIAAALRSAFLPRLLDFGGLRFSAVYRPLATDDQVGGDWYDTFVLPGGTIAFTMGDVSGHGLSAAASMLRLREGLRVAAFTEKTPGQSLALMNRMLLMGEDLFATALVAFIEPRRARLTVSIAGHPAPILVRSGTASMLPAQGIVLGASESATFEDVTLTLEPGDGIAFYTDGLIECEKRPIEGEMRLLAALAENEPERLESLVDGLFSGGQTDDATIVLLSYLAESTASWHFRADNADSARSAREAFCYHLTHSGVEPAAVSRAELVFGELIGNVVRHAPGPIEIDLMFVAGDAVLSVRDRGPGFEPHANRLPDEALAEHGRGLFLVEAYAGSAPLIAHRKAGGTKVIVTIDGAGGGKSLVVADNPRAALIPANAGQPQPR